MSGRTLTHRQYEELCWYTDKRPRWIHGGPPLRSLIDSGYVMIVPGSGRDPANSLFKITDSGVAAIASYRERYGINDQISDATNPDEYAYLREEAKRERVDLYDQERDR